MRDASKKMNADNHSAYLDLVHTYAYDPRDRARKVTKSDPGGRELETESYVHDANNNVVTQSLEGKNTAFTYDRNRLTTSKVDQTTATHAYDPFGRLDKVTSAGKLVEKYRYDGFDRIAEQQKLKPGSATERITTRYAYDPMDRTTTRTEGDKTTDFTYLGLSSEVLTEELGGKLDKSYQYSPSGQRLSQIKHKDDGSKEDTYYGYSPHTDVETLTDDKGATKATYGYTAYGKNDDESFTGIDKPEPQNPAKQAYNPYRFNGKRWDSATGDYDMGFRNYSPGRNTFLNRDNYNGALSDLGLATDPWTGNRYAFTHGNPINRIEIDGHIDPYEWECGRTGAACQEDSKAAAAHEGQNDPEHVLVVPPVGPSILRPQAGQTPTVSGPKGPKVGGLAGVLMLLSQALVSDSPQEEPKGPRVNVKEQERRCADEGNSLVAEIFYHNLDEMGRATGAEGCLKGRVRDLDEDARFTPPGWKRGMDRGHLIARMFGGSNTLRENFVPLYPDANQRAMRAVEDDVKGRLERGERVYYFVRPMWDVKSADPYIPHSIGIYVSSKSGSGWRFIQNR